MPDAIAIDFGTSRTKLAYWNPTSHRPTLMRFYRDDPFLPSLFYLFRDSERILWGHDAEEMLEKDPAGMVDVLKRKLREPVVRANRRKISPSELLALLFSDLRERVGHEVAAFAGMTPRQVFLTIPALYGPPDERVLREAAIRAGFAENQIELVPEPVAAARAWLAETGDSSQEVVVLDCGGGTIDWAYLRRQGSNFQIVSECPPGGDRHVGGYDVDLELLNRVKDVLEGEADSEIDQNRFHYLKQVRMLKERYCRGLPLYPLKIGECQVELDAREIQTVLEERFVQQACEGLKDYLEKVKDIYAGSLATILLVGGSARIKGLREAVEAQCGCKAVWWEHSEYATVLGAVPAARAAPPPPSGLEQYRIAVEMAWMDKQLDEADVERLIALAAELGLSREQAADLERKVMGDFKEAILDRQTSLNHQAPPAGHEPSPEAQNLINESSRLFEQGQLDAALQYAQAACELDPHWDEPFVAKAFLLYQKGEYRLAIAAASVCLKINPNASFTYFLRGMCKFSTGDHPGAIQDFDKAINLEPQTQYYEWRGIANVAVGNDRAAVCDIQAALQNPEGCTVPLAALYAAAGYLLHERIDSPNESLAEFASALESLPENPDAEFDTLFQDWCKRYGFETQEGAAVAIERCLWNACKAIHGCSRQAAKTFWNCHDRPSISIGDEDPEFAFFMASINAQAYSNDAEGLVLHWLKRLFAANPDFDVKTVKNDSWIQKCENPAVREFLTPTFSWSKISGSIFNSLTITNTSAFRMSSVELTVTVNRNDRSTPDVINKHLETLRAGESYTWNEIFIDPGFFGANIKDVTVSVSCAEA